MAKGTLMYIVGLVVLVACFTSCKTINTLYFDQLLAGHVCFPEEVKKVGVVNNMPTIINDEEAKYQIRGAYEGNGKIASEIMAQEIASTGYFDEVIVCDSALCNLQVSLKNQQGIKKEWPGNILSKHEVKEWTDLLGVDMLLSIERIYIELNEGSSYYVADGHVVKTIDGSISTILRAYVPHRDKPLFRINKRDTISWDVIHPLTYTKIVKESSEFAGAVLVPYLLPSWTEAARNYFDGGSVEMRDAGVYTREHNWEEAYPLWKKVYDEKKGQQKMRAAFNIALYYEMQGDFEQARKYLETASQLVKPETVDAIVVRTYLVQLESYANKYQQLRVQMKRFDDK